MAGGLKCKKSKSWCEMFVLKPSGIQKQFFNQLDPAKVGEGQLSYFYPYNSRHNILGHNFSWSFLLIIARHNFCNQPLFALYFSVWKILRGFYSPFHSLSLYPFHLFTLLPLILILYLMEVFVLVLNLS